jgi:hypothetical protein
LIRRLPVSSAPAAKENSVQKAVAAYIGAVLVCRRLRLRQDRCFLISLEIIPRFYFPKGMKFLSSPPHASPCEFLVLAKYIEKSHHQPDDASCKYTQKITLRAA